MACRTQSNPSRASSGGVPPELVFLGLRGSLLHTGLWNRSDRSAESSAGVDRFDDRSYVLAHSSVLARFCVNTLLTVSEGIIKNLAI